MTNIVAIGASNSNKSINRKLAGWVAKQVPNGETNLLDLNQFEMPIYSLEREQENGVPEAAKRFKELINNADGLVISFAEHNGSYSTAFKNIFDWVSRLEKPIWSNKPMLLLATSPGPRGAQSVLQTAVSSFPFQGGKVAGSFSLPSFNQNFEEGEGIIDPQLKDQFSVEFDAFIQELRKLKEAAA